MKILFFFAILFSFDSYALQRAEKFNLNQHRYAVGFKNPATGMGCSASKIGPKTYLTAAHCVDQYILNRYINLPIKIYRPGPRFYNRKMTSIFFHPNIDPSDFVANGKRVSVGSAIGHILRTKRLVDIAIFKIDKEIRDIRSAPIYRGVLRRGTKVTLVAYGKDVNGQYMNGRHGPQMVDKVDDDFIKIATSVIFPTYVNGADSGSPLIVRKNNRRYIGGVLSWSRIGFDTRKVGFYVGTDLFSQWASQVLENCITPDESTSF